MKIKVVLNSDKFNCLITYNYKIFSLDIYNAKTTKFFQEFGSFSIIIYNKCLSILNFGVDNYFYGECLDMELFEKIRIIYVVKYNYQKNFKDEFNDIETNYIFSLFNRLLFIVYK